MPALSAFVAFEVFVEYAMKMAADDRDLVWILTSLCCKAGFSWIIFQQSRIRGCLRRERERERIKSLRSYGKRQLADAAAANGSRCGPTARRPRSAEQ